MKGLVTEGAKSIVKAESATKATQEIFKIDSEVLKGLEGEGTPELIKGITEHLVGEGRPGSAEYLDVFSKTSLLDEQMSLMEEGMSFPKRIEQMRFPTMVDVESTSAEMISEGKVALTEDAKEDLGGALNSLRYKIDQHLGRTSERASEVYTKELTEGRDFRENMQRIKAQGPNPSEIPLNPTEAEERRLEELSKAIPIEGEEARERFKREFQARMKERPGLIGMEASAKTSKQLKKFAEGLSKSTKEGIEISELRALHEQLRGQSMEELRIYPEFGKAIEESIETDLKATKPRAKAESTPKPEALQGEVVYSQGEWLVDDIKTTTKNWLMNEIGAEAISSFNPEEQEKALAVAEGMMIEAQKRSPRMQEGEMTLLEALSKVEKNDDYEEALKLLLRIAVKVGTKAAVSIAKNISKDKDTPQELRIASGIFADLAQDGGALADKLLAGEENPDLTRDCINFIKASVS